MQELKAFVGLGLDGLPIGALYALQALGIVLIYRTTRVFSFAQAGLGVLAAFLTADLYARGLPSWACAIGGVSATVVASLLIELTVRYTRGPIQKTVVTLGWLLALQGLSALFFGLTGNATEVVSASAEVHVLSIDTVAFTTTRLDLAIYLVALVVGLGLALFLTGTSLGTAMRGVSDDPESARLLGLPVRRVAMLSWGVGGALAGLAGILAAPKNGGLDPTQLLVFTVAAIAVALIARLESLPLALAAGVGLGVLQMVVQHAVQLIPGQSQQSGVPQLTAFVVVLGSLVLRRRRGRADTGGGGLAPAPIRPLPRGPLAIAYAGGVVAAIVVLPLLVGGTGADRLVGIGVWALATLSLVVLAGVVGQVSICTGAFMGIGAFSAAIASEHGLPFSVALPIGAVVAAVAAALVALPAIRLEPLELAIATISLSFAADNFLFSFPPVVGESKKRLLDVPHVFSSLPSPAGSGAAGDRHLAWLCFGLLALCGLAAANLRRGRTGAALTALRSSRAAAAAMGFSVASAKLRGFATSGLIAGLAGGLLITHQSGSLQGIGGQTGVYDTTASITLLAYAVIGGLGSLPSALIGGLLVELPVILAGGGTDPDTVAGTTLASGAVLVLIVVLLPEGIVDGVTRLLRSAFTRSAPAVAAPGIERELAGAGVGRR